MSRKKAVLIYDGDCGFCKRWVERWRGRTGETVEYVASRQAGERFPRLNPEELEHAVFFLEPDGRQSRAAEAVFRLLTYGSSSKGWLWAYEHFPGFRPASELAYRCVSRHRKTASRLTRLFWGEPAQPPRYALISWIFLRALGLTYLAAFLSLALQADGLIGSRGLLPVSELLDAVAQRFGPERYRILPTLFWLSRSDAALRAACWGGAALSVLLLAGVLPRLVLPLLWAFYLSLVSVGGDFLRFQWDALLLETGLLAVLLAPPGLKPKAGAWQPPPAGVWLLRWLLFRLLFESGCVKLLSGDPSWRDLTALTYHYQTQPLPTSLAWYAHQLPLWWQKLSCGAVLFIELACPFLVFLPRRPRRLGFWIFSGLQLLIALTGNYAYFNLLTAALGLLLLDDAALPTRLMERISPPPSVATRKLWTWAAAGLVFCITLGQLAAMLAGPAVLPRPLKALIEAAAPWRSFNNYGLFAVMTKTRVEITVEGSNDGIGWKEYPFRWKPGDVRQIPRWAAPHQPRLDWQMWFAALSDYRDNPWLTRLLIRLGEGSPPALKLMADNPFPQGPPKYLRAVAWDYRFTTAAERRSTGAWWLRRPLGLYTPVLARP